MPPPEEESLLRGSLWMISGQGVAMAAQVLYFMLIGRALGSREYGAFVGVAALIASLSQFSSLGMEMILVRNVSRDRASFPRTWGHALLFTLAGFLALLGDLHADRAFRAASGAAPAGPVDRPGRRAAGQARPARGPRLPGRRPPGLDGSTHRAHHHRPAGHRRRPVDLRPCSSPAGHRAALGASLLDLDPGRRSLRGDPRHRPAGMAAPRATPDVPISARGSAFHCRAALSPSTTTSTRRSWSASARCTRPASTPPPIAWWTPPAHLFTRSTPPLRRAFFAREQPASRSASDFARTTLTPHAAARRRRDGCARPCRTSAADALRTFISGVCPRAPLALSAPCAARAPLFLGIGHYRLGFAVEPHRHAVRRRRAEFVPELVADSALVLAGRRPRQPAH